MTLNYHAMVTVGCDKKDKQKVECTMSSLLQFKLELETICESMKYFVFVYNREAKSCTVD